MHHDLVAVAGRPRIERRRQGALREQPQGVGAPAGRGRLLHVLRLRILRFLTELLGGRVERPADHHAHLRRQAAPDDEHPVGVGVDAEAMMPPPRPVLPPLAARGETPRDTESGEAPA